MRSLIVVAILSLLITASYPAMGSDTFGADISTLEMRFFFHTYADETDDQRLDRLDQVVFGHVRQGSEQTRITSLLIAVPNVQSAGGQQTASMPAALAPEQPEMASFTPAAAPPDPKLEQSENNQSTSEPYPTVTALEEQILGKSETNLPVAQRLSNLEAKAFGKPSTSSDLGARVDLLKRYVAEKNGGREDYLTSANACGWAPGNQSLEGEVSSMEKEVFGVTYARDRLASRLDRLEKNLLPNEPLQTFTPLVTRVNNLEHALNPNAMPQERISMGNDDDKEVTPKKKHSILHKLGVVALDVGSMAARSAMSSGGGYGYGGMPMMGSPLGFW